MKNVNSVKKISAFIGALAMLTPTGSAVSAMNNASYIRATQQFMCEADYDWEAERDERYDEYSKHITGDYNSDGVVDTTDLSILSLYLVDGTYSGVEDGQEWGFDVNVDSIVNLCDLATLKQYITKSADIKIVGETRNVYSAIQTVYNFVQASGGLTEGRITEYLENFDAYKDADKKYALEYTLGRIDFDAETIKRVDYLLRNNYSEAKLIWEMGCYDYNMDIVRDYLEQLDNDFSVQATRQFEVYINWGYTPEAAEERLSSYDQFTDDEIQTAVDNYEKTYGLIDRHELCYNKFAEYLDSTYSEAIARGMGKDYGWSDEEMTEIFEELDINWEENAINLMVVLLGYDNTKEDVFSKTNENFAYMYSDEELEDLYTQALIKGGYVEAKG